MSEPEINSLGGFELIVATAYHLGWAKRVEKIISGEIKKLKKRKIFNDNRDSLDLKGRKKNGTFTKRYNARKDVRTTRFQSISSKRAKKNFQSMNIISDAAKTIERKNLAMLALPVITMNGSVRTIDRVQQFVIDIVQDGKISGNGLSKHLKERCQHDRPPRTILLHLSNMGLSNIKSTLPVYLEKVKINSSTS